MEMTVSPLLQEEEKYLELDSRSESAHGKSLPSGQLLPTCTQALSGDVQRIRNLFQYEPG